MYHNYISYVGYKVLPIVFLLYIILYTFESFSHSCMIYVSNK